MKAQAMIMPKKYFFDSNGDPLAFGKVYTYQAGTTTDKESYTTEAGDVANTNPVILNGEGYASIYLNGSYNIVVDDADDVNIWTEDNVSSNVAEEWVKCEIPTYISPTSFKITSDLTSFYEKGRRVRIDNDPGIEYATIISSSFAAGETTVVIKGGSVGVGVIAVCVSIVGPESRAETQVLHYDTLADAIADISSIKIGDVLILKERTSGNGGGAIWDAVDETTVTENTFDIVVGDVTISFVLRIDSNGWVSALQFGNTGEAINAALAVANYVYCLRGTYLTSNTVSLATNQYLIGEGLANTNIQATAIATPSKIAEFNSASKANIANINLTWLGSSDVGLSLFESSKCNALGVGGNYLNQDSGAGITGGTFIKMDMGSNGTAYTHTVKDCDSQGADIYVHSIGPITACTFNGNKGRSADGYRFSRGTGVAGTAPIVGNRITNNLIQYYPNTVNTGVGIDFGVGDAASPDHTFANFIENNYIEGWDTGVLFRDGSVNNYVGPNQWENNHTIAAPSVPNNITDSTTTKDAYSEFAGTEKFIKLAEYKAEFRPAGVRFTNHITDDINYDGDKIDKSVVDSSTVSVNGRTLRLEGDDGIGGGAAVTGVILGIPGDDVDGQICILTGLTWPVTFVITNIDILAGFTMGNASGQYSGMTLQWDKTNQKWIPIGSFIRP